MAYADAIAWFRERPNELSEPLLDADLNLIRAHAVAQGKALCRSCREILGDEPGESCGLLDRGLCAICDAQWTEDRVLWPLIEILGRKRARKALRKLVRKAKDLV